MMRLVAAFLVLTAAAAAAAFTVCPTCTRRRSVFTFSAPSEDLVPAPAEKMTVSASISQVMWREDGQQVMDDVLLPASGYGDRIEAGRDAQGLKVASGVAISPNDPRMFLTYGEFPLTSLDELLDLALPYVRNAQTINMVDVGSGCGRLALYVALTRGSPQKPWQVHGIEISPVLHQEAVQALYKAMQGGYMEEYQPNAPSSLLLHAGPAEEWTEVLQKCNLVFAYSTAWPSNGFSEQMGAMIIGQQWSGLLSRSCPNGCIVITTDRALDPNDGWELIERLDVENREVMGSAGYVHILRG